MKLTIALTALLLFTVAAHPAARTVAGCIEGPRVLTVVEVRSPAGVDYLLPDRSGCFATLVSPLEQVTVTPRSPVFRFWPASQLITPGMENVRELSFESLTPFGRRVRF